MVKVKITRDCSIKGKHHGTGDVAEVIEKWSGRRGSNPRHSAWEADTLPTELLPLTL